MSEVQKKALVEVVVDASPSEVWDLLADVTRIGEWSHECRTARWLGDDHRPRPGTRFRGRNRVGWLSWSRTNEVISADAPRELVWRTVPTLLFPDSTEWAVELEPVDGGTAIRQSFMVVRAPWLLDRIYARLIPSHQDRDAKLTQDLLRLGAAAQRGATSRLGD
jgi:uncharacterized protein YndB with AHSA1/START domain